MKSKVDYKPEGFHTIVPYMQVKGAGKLLEFVKKAFDAEEFGCYRDDDGRINHAQVKIGDSIVELSDSTDQWPAMPCAIHMYVPDTDDTFQKAIAAGGTSLREPQDQFYGERSAAVRDVCGNNWYIGTRIEVLTKDEIEDRVAKLAGKAG